MNVLASERLKQWKNTIIICTRHKSGLEFRDAKTDDIVSEQDTMAKGNLVILQNA
jgi:hypothetical protein